MSDTSSLFPCFLISILASQILIAQHMSQQRPPSLSLVVCTSCLPKPDRWLSDFFLEEAPSMTVQSLGRRWEEGPTSDRHGLQIAHRSRHASPSAERGKALSELSETNPQMLHKNMLREGKEKSMKFLSENISSVLRVRAICPLSPLTRSPSTFLRLRPWV